MAAESNHVESSVIWAMLLLSRGGVSAIENGLAGSWKTVLVAGFMSAVCLTVIVFAWKRKVERRIPGPTGLPIIGSLLEMGGLAHRRLSTLAVQYRATSLMAFNLGSNPVVITCKPDVARDLLSSSDFADRPLKESAKLLLFGRAIGFAPYGEYWRNLRRIAATHLFSPSRIVAHEEFRQKETTQMLVAIWNCHSQAVEVRSFLQRAALNNIMMTVFGRRCDFGSGSLKAIQLEKMVREGFELLGAFNFADYFPALKYFSRQPGSVHERCRNLVSVVKTYVQSIIEDHRQRKSSTSAAAAASNSSDFVDVLISLQEKEKLSDDDMVAILWEMIFRGSDTTAILTEWALAELVLHPHIQSKLQAELDSVVGKSRHPTDSDIQSLPYLQAIVKETLRLHPPGPLLSWARLSRNDTHLSGHFLPRGTTAMVNMWAITHDENVWSRPYDFVPERFMASEGGQDVDVRGNDLRLAPFGAGRRVCPGRALGLATVHLWLARLVHHFTWVESTDHPVDLSEELKLSCQMVTPLCAGPLKRIDLPF